MNRYTSRLFCVVSGIFALVLSIVVMAGWIFEDPSLIRINPAFTPMQFNAALCFVFCSIAILLLQTRYHKPVLLVCAVTASIAAITLVQYLFDMNYGIDTWFLVPFTSEGTSHTGRMAANTSVAITLLSVAIALNVGAQAPTRRLSFIALLLASLATSLGVAPLIGFICGVEEAYGWGNLARMALHTACGVTVLGFATVVLSWGRSSKSPSLLLLPLAVGLAVISSSMALAVFNKENSNVRRFLALEAHHLSNETERQIRDVRGALGRIALRWHASGKTPIHLWKKDVGSYFESYRFLEYAGLLDRHNNIIEFVSRAGSGELANLIKTMAKSSPDDPHHPPIVSTNTGKSGYVSMYELSDGARMIVVIDFTNMFNDVLHVTSNKTIALKAFDKDGLIYSNNNLPNEYIGPVSLILESDDTPDWEIRVYPTDTLVDEHITRMPYIVLLIGLFTSGLVIASLYLLFQLRRDSATLKERKARLRAILNDAADGITLIDGKGLIEEFNPACEDLFGYSKAEVMGKNVHVLMPEPYHSEHDGYLDHYQKTKEKRIIGIGREVKGRRKDGTIFDIDLHVSEVIVPGKKIYMGMFRDITERKRTETIASQLMEKLEESNTELERFAYVASHDLREPLRLVANFARLLKKEYTGELNAVAGEYIEIITQSANRMYAMVSDLLEYARIGNEELTFSHVDLNKEMKHVLENLATAIEEHHAVITYDHLPTVMGNPVQLMRLLQNLAGNAVKFHAKGTSPKVHVSAVQDEGFWRFSIKDNGIGMAREYTDQIFEPFRQLHARNEYMGTGIGLAVCKRIVEKHHGKIWVESTLGKGSVFYFTLLR